MDLLVLEIPKDMNGSIFDGAINGKAVLVGIEVDSHYCYLLSEVDQRDLETGAIHWWELEEK